MNNPVGTVHRLVSRVLFFAMLLASVKPDATAQEAAGREIYQQLLTIEGDASLSPEQQLKLVLNLQGKCDQRGLVRDSVYARILHRIGSLQFSTGNLIQAIRYTIQSVAVNTSGKKGTNAAFTIRSYCNLGNIYKELHQNKTAVAFFDKCTLQGNRYKDPEFFEDIIDARVNKGNLYFQSGDYQKAIEELSLGLTKAYALQDDRLADALKVNLLNERAQAYAAIRSPDLAVIDADKALSLIEKDDYFSLSNNYKIRAAISESHNDFDQALADQKKAIALRLKAGDPSALARDYLDAGNTSRAKAIAEREMDFSEARTFYRKSLQFARQSGTNTIAGKALNNLAALHFRTRQYSYALDEYHRSLMQTVVSFTSSNPVHNPSYQQCAAVSDKYLLSLVLANKTECMLYLYKQSNHQAYLAGALETAMLTDSIITDMRREQTSEQSKLYWREETREFFSNAIEAAYQAHDGKLAFYLMEKSRAVLLYDKLNELGAAALLPPDQANKEMEMQLNVLAAQQKMSAPADTDEGIAEQQAKLFQAKEDLDNYIRTLQDKYPSYYQYKYADDVADLAVLQNYLRRNQQSFVHYFINDSAVYILAILPSSLKFIKLEKPQFNTRLVDLLNLCSNKQTLNNHYNSFAALSFDIYRTLFEPLSLPEGRVIVCYDNVLIPFEALTTDTSGRTFLVNNYIFSYVYSARFLLKNFNNPPGRGNFLGIAPVSYATSLQVPDLRQSENSLDKSAANYSGYKLVTNHAANRSNFFRLLPVYTIVTILSHARADSTDKEPILFMADSIILLSELQRLRNPSTKLVVLSACQTNKGKVATGEGIISLARGFSSAGIPSTSATLWKADENAIYSITEAFLKNISDGMRKDDALQKAKILFMQNNSSEKSLPFYWANMVLAGNGDRVGLEADNYRTWWFAGAVLLIAALLYAFALYRKGKS